MKWKDIKETLWGQNPQQDIDTWKEPDPDDVTIDNAYKTRWIWYHTILAVELFLVVIIQLLILFLLAVKL
jgi:hypothetical protein|tara:strand:+ start:349 stop:558 length:210 start_codon:yes stop_codon:yes gene_type:complete